jgi:hypothetical protein
MSLTPRQAVAYLEFSHKLDRNAQATDLAITAIGSQGDKQAIDKTLKELSG